MKTIVSDPYIAWLLLVSPFTLALPLVFGLYGLAVGGIDALVRTLPIFILFTGLCFIVPLLTTLRFRRLQGISKDGIDIVAELSSCQMGSGVRPLAKLLYSYAFEGHVYEKCLRMKNNEATALLERKPRTLSFRIDPCEPKNFVVVDELYQ